MTTSILPLAAKSTPLISGRGDSFDAPFSRRISSDYNNTSNQQNEEWGVIQEQQQQPTLVSSLSNNSMLSSSHGLQQHKENPLLTRLLDAKGCSTGVSVGGSNSMLVADRNEVAPSSSVAIESNNNSFGTLAKAKVRAEKKVEEKVIKCIDLVDKGVDKADQDDKMLIDEEEEETSKENHKPREDTTSSSPPSTASSLRTTSTTSKWSQSIVNSCPWWITSFLPSASTESQAFLMSPSSSVAAVDNDEVTPHHLPIHPPHQDQEAIVTYHTNNYVSQHNKI